MHPENTLPASHPDFIPVHTSVIRDQTLPPGCLQSYLRLYAEARQHGYRRTSPLAFARQLEPLLGLRRTQVRQHLRTLEIAKLLRCESDGRQNYTIHFLLEPPSLPRGQDAENPDNGDVLLNIPHSEEIKTVKDQQHSGSANPASRLEGLDRDSPAARTYEQVRGWLARAGEYVAIARRYGAAG